MNTKRTLAALAIGLAVFATADAASAHTGATAATGFAAGFAHPVGGLDHLLAMVGVGLLAWMLKGRALWLVPACFLGMMALGGVLGQFQVPVPMVEFGIALSIVAIGALVALGRSVPVAAAMAIVGAFAIFHGHAHGTEMPEAMSGLSYGIGFIASTALLHGLGVLAGFAIGRAGDVRGLTVGRAGGAAMTVLGIALVAGAL